MKRNNVVVGIPVKNEEFEITGCLYSLCNQDVNWLKTVVICANNCTDNTIPIINSLLSSMPFKINLIEITLPPDIAHVGMARRLVMDVAAELAGPQGIILCTDADSIVPSNWIRSNVTTLESGIDAVSGCVVVRGDFPFLWHLRRIETYYSILLTQIESILDPIASEIYPTYLGPSGASIAVTVAMYRKVGGIPILKVGEDTAFYENLYKINAKVRHSQDMVVLTSGRIDQHRTPGGMSDIGARTIIQPPVSIGHLGLVDAIGRLNLRRLWRKNVHPDEFGKIWNIVNKSLPTKFPLFDELPFQIKLAEDWLLLHGSITDIYKCLNLINSRYPLCIIHSASSGY
jgi:glycosyltransferase involved in cell wall biosynthesis